MKLPHFCRMLRIPALLFLSVLFINTCFGQTQISQNWSEWVAQLRAEALAQVSAQKFLIVHFKEYPHQAGKYYV